MQNFGLRCSRSIVAVDPFGRQESENEIPRGGIMSSFRASRWRHPALQPGWIDRAHQQMELGDLALATMLPALLDSAGRPDHLRSNNRCRRLTTKNKKF
jgi:hypothetical protein